MMYIHGGPHAGFEGGETAWQIRLPAAVVDALKLKEGDDIEIRVAGKREFEVDRDESRQRALGDSAQVKPSLAGRVCLRPRRSA